jgi:hypothetical protein
VMLDVERARLRRLIRPDYDGAKGPEEVAILLRASGRDTREAAAAIYQWVLQGWIDNDVVAQAEKLNARPAVPEVLPAHQMSESDVEAAAHGQVADALREGRLRGLGVGDGLDRFGRPHGTQRQSQVTPEQEAVGAASKKRRQGRWGDMTGQRFPVGAA